MNKFLNTRGMTLIELLGAIVIMGIVAGLIFPIMGGGIKTSQNIQKETTLRNEADYLMASFVKELYTLKESEIAKTNFPASNNKDFYIQAISGKNTGFIGGKVVIGGVILPLTNQNIVLLPSQILKIDNGQYEVTLRLRITGEQPKEMDFVNVISTINDVQKEEED